MFAGHGRVLVTDGARAWPDVGAVTVTVTTFVTHLLSLSLSHGLWAGISSVCDGYSLNTTVTSPAACARHCRRRLRLLFPLPFAAQPGEGLKGFGV